MAILTRLLLFCLFALAGCAPVVVPAGPDREAPRVTHNLFDHAFFVARDGEHLPMRVWRPPQGIEAQAVIVALHGMNDYANAFALPGPVFARNGIITYAIDQRGHGGNVPRGLWPGVESLTRDFEALVVYVRSRHPDLPVYALGVSMGGAVVMTALGAEDPPDIDGAVLIAPAVWGPQTLPASVRASLWLASRTMGGVVVTGRMPARWPTDNIALLRQMAADVRVQNGARIDALYGLVRLMGAAYDAAPRIRVPVLLLYGERDQIVPRRPTREVVARMPAGTHVAVYENGYHLLLRDRQRAIVHRDITHWVLNDHAALPSGADRRDAMAILSRPRPTGQRPATATVVE